MGSFSRRLHLQLLAGDGPQPNFTRETFRSAKEFKPFFLSWLRLMWLDLLFMAALGGAALGIYQGPIAFTRTFAITFDRSGDIVFPSLAYPNRGWVIEAWLSGLLSAGVPIAVILLAQIRVRSFWDANNGIMGVLWSLILSAVVQVTVKHLIGGFRPYFLDVCMPDISLASSNNGTGLNGVGFQQIMYTSEICTNPDKALLKTAMTSFPSGHSTTALAGFMFLFLYLNAKLKVWAAYRPSFWKVALTLAPLLGAFLKVCSLSVDQAHHWYDMLAGSLIGTGTAFASYRACYAAIWDSRFNHIPLRKNDDYAYSLQDGSYQEGVFSRSAGWGRGRKPSGGGGGLGPTTTDRKPSASGRSSGTYAAGRVSMAPPTTPDQNLRVPGETSARARQKQADDEGPRGDDIV